jgi:hypothetical protein
MSLYWMSFADPDKPKGQQFLGAVILEASSLSDAIQETWRKGINPGGEVVFLEIAPDKEYLCPPETRNALLSREELTRHFPDLRQFGLDAGVQTRG